MDQDKARTAKIINVLVAVPNEGHTEPKAYDNRMENMFRLGSLQIVSAYGIKEFEGSTFNYPDGIRFKFHQATIGKVFTALARERLGELALDINADFLYMIDDDMLAPADIFERLYRHNVDIVAALAFTRYAPHKPVIYTLKSGYDPVQRKEYYCNYPVLNYPRNTLVQCDAVGFGAVLIKTRVLKEIKKPWFMTTSGAGEDIHFCHQAIKAGFKVYMDTSTKLGHMTDPIEITEETFDSEQNQKMLKGECNAKP